MTRSIKKKTIVAPLLISFLSLIRPTLAQSTQINTSPLSTLNLQTLPPPIPEPCPEECTCNQLQREVSCNANLNHIPHNLPTYTSYLTLNNNNFGMIPANAFSSLQNLLSLQMIQCNITDFQENAFQGLDNLRRLDLRNNALQSINNKHFLGLDNLLELHLQGNNINSLESNSYSDLKELQLLSLDNNPITNLGEDLFDNENNLKELNLRFCALSLVPSAFLQVLPNLQALDLSGNSIEVLPPQGFVFLKQLQELSLSAMFPKLHTIHDDAFNGLDSLQVLDLSDNLLHSVNSTLFQVLPSLQKMHLEQNPWICDCQMRALIEWLQTTQIDYFDQQWQCNQPSPLSSQTVFTIRPFEKFACEPYFFSKPENRAIEYNEGAFFEFEVGGDPSPTIAWQLPDGTEITAKNDASNEYIERDGTILIIRQARPYHVGQFTIRATNGKGTTSVTFQVIVLNIPVTEPPTSPAVSLSSSTYPPPCVYIPVQVLVRDITDTSALLRWIPYNSPDLLGYILQTIQFGENENDLATFVDKAESSYVVTSLQPNTAYLLCVTVYLNVCPSFNSLDQCVQITTQGSINGEDSSSAGTRQLIGVAVACIAGTLLVMASVFLILWQYQRPRSYTKYDFKSTEDTTRFADIEPSFGFGDVRIEDIGSHRTRNGKPHIYDNPTLDSHDHDYEAPDVHNLKTFRMEVDVHPDPEDRKSPTASAGGTMSTFAANSTSTANGKIIRISETDSDVFSD